VDLVLKRDIEGVDWDEVSSVYAETLGHDDPAQLQRTWSRSYATVLALVDGRLVGVARAISDGEREALIVGVAVRPSHQRRGIGTAMMRALMQDVSRTAMILTCEEDENVAFYEKLGFRTHKRTMVLGYSPGAYAS
jgi:ribosomal protein S18 acetylase RimI-like enzyme